MFALFFYTNSFPFCFIVILTMSNTYFIEHSLTPVGRIWGESCTYFDVIVQAQIIFLVTGELRSPPFSKRLRRPVKAVESGKQMYSSRCNIFHVFFPSHAIMLIEMNSKNGPLQNVHRLSDCLTLKLGYSLSVMSSECAQFLHLCKH